MVLSEATTGDGSRPGAGAARRLVVLAAAWARYELRRRDPLVDLRQARHRMVLTADLAGLFISLTMYLFLPIVVEFVQVPPSFGFGFGVSVLVAGCVSVPLSVGTLAGQPARRLSSDASAAGHDSFGSSAFRAVESRLRHRAQRLWEAFLVMGIAGIGIGFTFAAMPGFIVQAVAQDTGSAMGFYQVLRSIGLAIGSALSGVILAGYTQHASLLPAVGGFRTRCCWARLCLLTAVLC